MNPLTDRALYQAPARECDVVMKGGVTSGIVYPLAICELARTYRFRCIGGTSAGAIAAVLTAAAELGRSSDDGGFSRLAALPSWLGAQDNLLHLFQPQPATERLFALVNAAITPGDDRARALINTATSRYAAWALAAMALPLLIIAVALWQGGSANLVVAVAAFLVLIVAALLGAAAGAVRDITRVLAPNGFGLCSGMPGAGAPATALSPFLHEQVQRAAGRTLFDPPVTFGDLHQESANRQPIELVLMTTDLTHGRPFHLPFEQRIFYFDPVELKRCIPEAVVDWMVARQRPRDDKDADEVDTEGGRLVPLPEAEHIPIAFAARLSCSFPILLSAVPLYAVDYTRTKAPEAQWPLTRCWFSDGGISSNFPVHFFDGPMPSRPTFGINLRPFHPDFPPQADESQNVWMPRTNNQGQHERLYPAATGDGAVGGFIGMILSTMQNWRDNGTSRMAGYRDRIVHVHLTENEGGLNLAMDEAAVARLAERGRCAGALLAERYTKDLPGVDVSWDNQRWVRYRAFLSALQPMIRMAVGSYEGRHPPDRDYRALVERREDELPRGYRWSADQRASAVETMTVMANLVAHWDAAGPDAEFRLKGPKPTPSLRVAPPE